MPIVRRTTPNYPVVVKRSKWPVIRKLSLSLSLSLSLCVCVCSFGSVPRQDHPAVLPLLARRPTPPQYQLAASGALGGEQLTLGQPILELQLGSGAVASGDSA